MSVEEFERNQEMWKLRHIDGWTLQAIAIKHGGISRERVRQIIGNTGKEFRKEWTEEGLRSGRLKHPTHWAELEYVSGVRKVYQVEWGKYRHMAISGFPKLGQKFEQMAHEILCEFGIQNELMVNRCPFDIKLSDGIRIDVKVSNVDVSKIKSQKSVYPTWQIPELKSGRDCDYFFIFVPDHTEIYDYTYFIIPAFEANNLSKGSKIRIPWPKMGNKSSKWQKYHKRIDLIL